MFLYRDSVAQPVPLAAWAMLFRQEMEDAMKRGCFGGSSRLGTNWLEYV